jgi:hypothetical protein
MNACSVDYGAYALAALFMVSFAAVLIVGIISENRREMAKLKAKND